MGGLVSDEVEHRPARFDVPYLRDRHVGRVGEPDEALAVGREVGEAVVPVGCRKQGAALEHGPVQGFLRLCDVDPGLRHRVNGFAGEGDAQFGIEREVGH